jgi:thiol-disulfide isomerase/thioredoxin
MKTLSSLLLILFLAGCFGQEPMNTNHNGKDMPEFSLFLADSSTYFNTAALKGEKPVIFFYFGPGCPYCRGQIEEIIANAEKFRNIQFVLLTTSPFEEMKWFYKHYQLDKYHNIIAGVDYTSFFGDYFDAKGVPYLAVYGQDKKLRRTFDGKVPVKQLCRALD